ncbi:hypothetical protein HDV05_001589 [Chytridiales sp. JEL 0842]|nr:hypothetical protein HDV05_001589 [Chytridiales sp. JEL 0842]
MSSSTTSISITITHNNQKYALHISPSTTLRELMSRCSEVTNVPTDRMKLLMSGGEAFKSSSSSSRSNSPRESTTATGSSSSRAGNSERGFERFFGGVKAGMEDFVESVGRGLDEFVGWVTGDEQQSQSGSSSARTRADGERGAYVMMKDLNATMTHYGIKTGTKILVVGEASGPRPPPPSTSRSTPTSNQHPTAPPRSTSTQTPTQKCLSTLSTHLTTIKSTIAPFLDTYHTTSTLLLSTPPPHSALTDSQKRDLETMRKLHAQIGELVLQVLMKVDGVVLEEGTEEERGVVRERRKGVVKELNGILEGVDGVKERVEAWRKGAGGTGGTSGGERL